jgi:hypothetical protein
VIFVKKKLGYIVFLHFDHENKTGVETDEPSELLELIAKQKNGWLKLDEKLIHLDNVSYITYQKKKELK